MKNFTLLISVITISGILFGQKPNADFSIINCQPITGNYLFAAETEVSNSHYLEFLWHTKKDKGEKAYKEMLPDTLKWIFPQGRHESYSQNYLRHPAYRNYPAVNISREQAQAYCQWLTQILNDKYQKDEKHPVEELLVRLPTEKEWEKAAKAGNPNAIFSWKGSSMRRTDKKFKGVIRANFIRGRSDYMGVAGILNDNADLTAPIDSYWPNEYGLHNMSGNVAEIIDEENKVKGGGWKSQAMNLEIDTFENFKEPRPDVGFRYFIEIVSFKDVTGDYVLKAKEMESLLGFVPSGLTHDSISVQSFLMSKTEVTNKLYRLFVAQNPSHTSQNKLWKDAVPYSQRLVNDYASHSEYDNYPVVNISKESAQAFCDWLSKEYSKLDKIKYKNLKFRLPKEVEWEMAAMGGLSFPTYAWGGPYIRNSKGCFLANHLAVPIRFRDYTNPTTLRDGVRREDLFEFSNRDGAYIPAAVNSYNPNGYGMYNMSGNVAEMLGDKDFLKGGSWKSLDHHLQIKAREEYIGASPTTGFRIVASYMGK